MFYRNDYLSRATWELLHDMSYMNDRTRKELLFLCYLVESTIAGSVELEVNPQPIFDRLNKELLPVDPSKQRNCLKAVRAALQETLLKFKPGLVAGAKVVLLRYYSFEILTALGYDKHSDLLEDEEFTALLSHIMSLIDPNDPSQANMMKKAQKEALQWLQLLQNQYEMFRSINLDIDVAIN